MLNSFDEVISQMKPLMDKLLSGPALGRGQLTSIPRKGIYVFYEDGKPIYVGRSNRMKERIQEHGRNSSKHESATFAFNLALEHLGAFSGHDANNTRKEIQEDPSFERVFAEQKARVRNMQVRVVEIEDQILQTIFEVYAVIHLGTGAHNSFDTH